MDELGIDRVLVENSNKHLKRVMDGIDVFKVRPTEARQIDGKIGNVANSFYRRTKDGKWRFTAVIYDHRSGSNLVGGAVFIFDDCGSVLSYQPPP